MKTNRLQLIDSLRGLAMLMMVMIHTNAYFLHISLVKTVWDYSEMAVPVFIFCSNYLFFKKTTQLPTLNHLYGYLKKRFIRLLLPYYVFLAVLIPVTYFKDPGKITGQYLANSIFLNGGVDINWLVLLFLVFSFLMPVLMYLKRNIKPVFLIYILIALAASLYLVFYPFPYNYRLIMWLPWSLLLIFSYYFVENEANNRFLLSAFFSSLILFLVLRLIMGNNNHSLLMYDNKYPPNLYHIAYGVLSVIGLYWLERAGLFNVSPVKQLLHFLSIHSYSIYFIHYLIIYILTVYLKIQFTWQSFFIWVFLISISVQFLLNRVLKLGKS